MAELLFAGVIVLIIVAVSSKHPIVKTFARIFTGLFALASASSMMFLFNVGQKAHWTSDGPGMLIVMVGILVCGALAVVFGWLFFFSFTGSQQ